MSKNFTAQATAFGLAALVTLATLSSLNVLAVQENSAAQFTAANNTATTQQVVIVAKRLPRA